jgi:hypothetical protein
MPGGARRSLAPARETAETPATKTDAEILNGLADRLNRLTLSQVDPQRYHAEKSDITARLRAVARRLSGVVHRAPSTTWRSGKNA